MITKEEIQEQYLKEKKFSYMNPIVANIDYVKWLETELINTKKQLPINGVVKSLKDKKSMSFAEWFDVHGYYHADTMWLKNSSICGLGKVYQEYNKYLNRNL
tara:strand:+ start:34705 stop:35010 length:306 start_codon:yes stop_codon:yes gene_type:complete